MGYFFYHKRALNPKFAAKLVYFQAFKNSYPQERSGKHKKNLELKVSVLEKKILLWYRYRNWTLVKVLDTKTWFRLYTKLQAKVKVLQKERSMWVAKNVEWLQVWLLTLLLYDLDAHFCSFILKVSFFGISAHWEAQPSFDDFGRG